MDEQRQLLFVNHFLPSNEQKLIDRLRDAGTRRVTRPPEVTRALRDVPLDTVVDVVVGPSYIGVLFADGQISRFPYVATARALAPSASPAKTTSGTSAAVAGGSVGGGGGGTTSATAPSGGSGGGTGTAAHPSLIARTAKFRRVMLATSGRRDHRSVIIDRARPVIAASSVPEDLIVQAQVVLQGKSREVIVRELQRTSLNVNEAVNNLLSRDDDEEEGSEGAEMCIPEELLTLLDSTHGLETELYGGDSFEYLINNRERKSRTDKEKEKQKSSKPIIEGNSDTEALRRYEVPEGSIADHWEGQENKESVTKGTARFSRIACTHSELLAISATDHKLYGWKWSEPAGDSEPHVMYQKMKLADGEAITHVTACSLRVAVMTSHGRISTWLDTVACGERLSEALFVPPQKLQTATSTDCVEELAVSNQLAVARFPGNVFFWCGLYPVNDRRRIFEKARSRQRKHVTFDTTQIVEGSEVRTKSGPIYSIGCIAANLSGATPMVGILMENAWSLSEMCRFRLLDPSAYDADRYDAAAAPIEDTEEKKEAVVAQHALTSGSRKRPATEELFGTTETKHREDAWLISDVVFIHEEVQNDTAIVKIVDGGYCAVEYRKDTFSSTDLFATSISKHLARKGDEQKPQPKMRLIRKDELTVVSAKMRYARSPNSIRVQPYKFVLAGSTATKRVVSAVADSLGIRALVERRGGATSIVRISVCGKTLTSHPLPLHAESLHATATEETTAAVAAADNAAASPYAARPTLVNYGDDAILLLRDAHGGLIPLVRDAAAGFREPTYLQLPASTVSALVVKNVGEKERPSWAPKANREAVILTLQGTHPRTLERRLPSLLHTVLCCDEKAVKAILDILEKEEDLELSKREIVDGRADGARNVLHAAVMNAAATKNSLEADVENPMALLTSNVSPDCRASAEQVRQNLDRKWNEMLKTRASTQRSSASASTSSTASGGTVAAPLTISTDATQTSDAGSVTSMEVVIVPESQMPTAVVKVEEVDENALVVIPSPVEHPKERQESSIAIVKMLVTHPICMPYLTDLLGTRDIHGQTPFMAAVNNRAYSAARSIFKAIRSIFVDDHGKWNADQLAPFIFPSGSRPDDSPLFILCYNDTCSFTWTGEEHINQDIFECRTCGLTGTLCCCTECAFTCHRNHDCKLKRTSPTAYCDCWEKACCKALVNGNEHAREALLAGLISSSNLYTMQNGRGEHVLLYLARKWARQSSEQWNYTRRPRRIQAPSSSKGADVPEHDLEPPKFAKTALLYCLRNWNVIKSMAMIGVRQSDHSLPMAEDLFHLNAQHGSSHLDKFMLILLTKCTDEASIVMESMLGVLTEAHNKARETGENLEEVNFVISRFVRSVARLFILAVVISAVAATTAISGVVPKKESSGLNALGYIDRGHVRGIPFSTIFGHMRKDNAKDSKLKNMGTFIVRCKVFFEHFAIFALHEMAQLADASLAPVRTGIIRPCVSLAAVLGPAADSLESLEKYINSEPDVTQFLGRIDHDGIDREERKEGKKRRKRSSRREAEREDAASESQGANGASERSGGGGGGTATERDSSAESDSDSDSDGDGPSSRRHASQSSALAANDEPASATEEASRRSNGEEEYSSEDDEEVESDSEGDRRDDDEEEEEEEEDEDMPREEDVVEEEDAEMDYGTSEGEAPTSAAGEEGRGETEESRRAEEEEEERREDRREEDEEVAGSLEGSRSPSSPEYSSEEEAANEVAAVGGQGDRRGRRKAARASAVNEGADSVAVVQPPAEEGVAVAAEQDLRVEVAEPMEEEREERLFPAQEGSARTRPDARSTAAPAASAAGGATAASAADAGTRRAEAAVAGTDAAASNETPSTGRAGTASDTRTVFGRRAARTPWDDRLTNRRNATDAGSSQRVERSSSSGNWSYRRPPMPAWITRIGDERGGTRGGASTTANADDKKGEGATDGKAEEAPTALKTGIQLATAFSFAVRVIGELLPVVAVGRSATSAAGCAASSCKQGGLNVMDEAVRRRAIDHVGSRLEESWRWLAVVLDHVEAQIKYINAVASVEESKKRENREKKKSTGASQRKKSPVVEPATTASSSSTVVLSPSPTSPQPASKARRESMAIIMGVLRAHSGEAGDDTPIIDRELLKAPALVVDAYLGFVEAKAEAEKAFESSKSNKEAEVDVMETGEDTRESGEERKKDESGGIEVVRRFYQRSNSVSFPGASFTDAHDTLQMSCMQSLPIVERPQLLTSTVDKEVIFGPPPSTQERTKAEHDKVIRAHGLSHPHNQSLTAAPVASHRLFVVDKDNEVADAADKIDVDHGVHCGLVSIPSVASAPAHLNEMGTEKKKGTSKGGKRGRKRGRHGEIKSGGGEDEQSESQSSIGAATGDRSPVHPPAGFERVTYEEILETFKKFREHPLRKLMGRWRFTLQLIARELHEELTDALGGDLSGSALLRELAGFEIKQNELRTRMEKYKANATKDISIEVHRETPQLVRDTCYQLNRAYTMRVAIRGAEGRGCSMSSSKRDESLPPLASHKVKVKFVDEPGEGTGVARSYYTALAEALVSIKQLPFADYGYGSTNDEYLYGGPITPGSSSGSSSGGDTGGGTTSGGYGSRRRIQLIRDREAFYATVASSAGGSARRKASSFDRRLALNYLHPPYSPADITAAQNLDVSPAFLLDLREETYTRRDGGAEKLPTELLDRLFILIRVSYPSAAARLTGMFMDLPLSHIILALGDNSVLKGYLNDAIELMMQNQAPADISLLRGEDEKKDASLAGSSTEADDAPLFFRPSKKAHYSPVPGRLSPIRISAFRNVGRVIGLCLMQCEMFPLRLSRHVLKYILGRPLNWHDFAFYDPQMFESLRKLIVDGCSSTDHAEYFDALQMTFSANMPMEATGLPTMTIELIPGGSDVLVTKENVIDYVYRLVEAKLLGSTNGRCLSAIRQGVQDVIPQAMLDNLTAEDLRLVLCGTETVSLTLMQSYTAWTDESHASPDTIAKYKQWFWQVADRLSEAEKQDLIFFWTGAPSLPSTEEGFQPLPTIVIRPSDDGFLPTANTCISRLYLPHYNSKKILAAKLQLAIKSKNFGFV